MQFSSKKIKFLDSQEAIEIRKALKLLASDVAYNTEASYAANDLKYPDHNISFVDKHMLYLSEHPSVNPKQYLSNLRLMTRIR